MIDDNDTLKGQNMHTCLKLQGLASPGGWMCSTNNELPRAFSLPSRDPHIQRNVP